MSKLLACWDDLIAKVQTVASLTNRVVRAYDPDDLHAQTTALPAPCAGVMYEGMRASSDVQVVKQGKSTVAVFGIYLLVDSPVLSKAVDRKAPAIELLEQIRGSVLETFSPTGHPWAFVVETYVAQAKGKSLWNQRWQTALINQR